MVGPAGLVAALEAAGWTVRAVAARLDSRSDADALFSGPGPVDLAVHGAAAGPEATGWPLVDGGEAAFASVWEGVMRSTMWFLQAAARGVGEGGSAVIVIPAAASSPAAGQAAWAAAGEAQRVLAMSVAMLWRDTGRWVNCVSAPSPDTDGVADAVVALTAAPVTGCSLAVDVR